MNKLRPLATELRRDGYSYSYISKQLGVAKSTLSNWFKNEPFTPNEDTLTRVKLGQAAYGQRKKQLRVAETHKLLLDGKREVGVISKRDLWMIGLGLWLGEGSKTVEQIRLANADPKIIQVWLRWLREVCKLQNTNITIRMHLYEDTDEAMCREYWKAVTKLDYGPFRKTQFDKRPLKQAAKNGKLPYGTLHVCVVGAGNPEFGVRLHRRMMGWVSAIM